VLEKSASLTFVEEILLRIITKVIAILSSELRANTRRFSDVFQIAKLLI
jgi:hypothetical protein